MMKSAVGALVLATFSLSFAGHATAADAVTPAGGSLLDLLQPVYAAFSGGQYAYCAALAVILMVALLKQYGIPWAPKAQAWLHSDIGGSLTALAAASATACASALATPGAHITLALLKSALLVGVAAAGGYAGLKNLIVEPLILPLQAWLEKKVPQLASVLGVVTWIFVHGDVAPSDHPQPAPAPAPTPEPAPTPAPPVAPTGN